MGNTWKIVLASLTIFLAGVFTGTLFGTLMNRSAMPIPPHQSPSANPDDPNRPPRERGGGPPGSRSSRSESFHRDYLERLEKELNLSNEQKQKIDQILKESRQRMEAIHEKVNPQVRQEFHFTKEKIEEILSEDQRIKYKELLDKGPRPRGRRPGPDEERPPEPPQP